MTSKIPRLWALASLILPPIYGEALFFGERPVVSRHHARMIPRSSSLAAALPPLIVIALLPHLRLRKLLRRFVQTALGNFGWLPFHASFLTTLCLKVNLKTSVITDNQKAEIIATLSTRHDDKGVAAAKQDLGKLAEARQEANRPVACGAQTAGPAQESLPVARAETRRRSRKKESRKTALQEGQLKLGHAAAHAAFPSYLTP